MNYYYFYNVQRFQIVCLIPLWMIIKYTKLMWLDNGDYVVTCLRAVIRLNIVIFPSKVIVCIHNTLLHASFWGESRSGSMTQCPKKMKKY